jgi:23S rRNA (uridine2552-2'-O)-methyltransferase
MLTRIGGGSILGIDLIDAVRIEDPRFHYLQLDITDENAEQLIYGASDKPQFDIIASDAAPGTTGNKFMDAQRSLQLVRRVFEIADTMLKSRGSAVAKLFQGEDVHEYVQSLKTDYERVALFKPKSSRSESRELFIVAMKRRKSGDS